jgi:hypothetical protein
MKKVLMSVIGFAIAVALVVAIWIPLATHGKNTGTANEAKFDSVDTNVNTLASPIP